MISTAHLQLMARYNGWQNRSLYREADRIGDAARRQQRGAFFGSIHGTLCHVLFGDQIWLYRFTNGATVKPRASSIAESVTAIADWEELKRERFAFDDVIAGWTRTLDPAWLQGELTWHSAALGRAVTRPTWELATHFFNHQTHHRGQVHAMITAAGGKPDDTDLPFMPD